MDITNKLPDHVWLEDSNGVLFPQDVSYDWTPSFCERCNKVGDNCEKPKPKKEVKKVWVPAAGD